jgi:hypothetical protein
VELELLKYNASQPWYIGGFTTQLAKIAHWGNHAHGGAGIFVSRGAVQWMEDTYAACAKTSQSWGPGDHALARCVLLHDIPVTRHPGMHILQGWHPSMWEQRPSAPLLAVHNNMPLHWTPVMRKALAVNPSGFTQQARLLVPIPGRKQLVVHISSGVAVSVWEEGTPGTDAFHLNLPSQWDPAATQPPQVERPPALAHFVASDIVQPSPQGNCTILTKYKAHVKNPKDLKVQFQSVEVSEPYWPDRWLQGPLMLCTTAWQITTNSSSGAFKLLIHLGRGPEGCLWEGFDTVPQTAAEAQQADAADAD